MSKSSLSLEPKENAKRINAVDPNWSLAQVPFLSKLCLQTLMENIGANPIYDQLNPSEQRFIQEKLPLSTPLVVTSNLISDGVYWQRKCTELWDILDIITYGMSWKRMFFERYMEGLIELYDPGESNPQSILSMVPLCKNYIRRLNITQLLPPIKETSREEEEEQFKLSSLSDGDDELGQAHFDFSLLLNKLSYLEELHLVYRVKQCGMNFEMNMFQMTKKDCEMLGQALKSCKTLKILHLTLSNVNNAQCRVLVKNLLNHPALIELDLSYNKISDSGARALGKLITHSKLQILKLYNNYIGDHGAEAIAHALSTNSTLESLHLGLNHVEDEGGQALANALLNNSCLKTLILRGNIMAEQTALALSNALLHNSTLTCLTLSNNKLGAKGGSALCQAMLKNTTLTEMDVNLTGMEEGDMDFIEEVLWSNGKQACTQEQQTPEEPAVTESK